MMIEQDQQEIAAEFGLLPFHVNVLRPVRTLCEKIMSLVRFSYSENPMDALKMKIRHVYDLHKMLEQLEMNNFFGSDAFSDVICRVAGDDVQNFRNNNEWLENHPADALLFRDAEDCCR